MAQKDDSTIINESNQKAPTKRGALIPELRSTLRRYNFSSENRNHKTTNENSIDVIMSSETLTREALSKIAVCAFIGQSGTGKSTRAISVARSNDIHFLIDDGLLVNGSRIVAGTSAKKAQTKMESVRQALFVDPTRSAVMRRALVESAPTALMILGTSDSMLQKICNNLWLNQPSMLIRIEDVTTEEERRHARKTRLTEGMHTIPVPSMEIKHEFSGYFSDPLNKIRQRLESEHSNSLSIENGEQERTMVRPTFSSLGSYSISDDALLDLITICLKKITGFAGIVSFKTEKRTIGVVVSVGIALYYGFDAQEALFEAQQKIGKAIEEYTSITTVAVNVRAVRLVHNSEAI